MTTLWLSLLVFFALCILAFFFIQTAKPKVFEGLENGTNGTNGIAGGAQAYTATIKSIVTKNQDVLLISKYRTDYENAILNLDDLVSSQMLQTALSIDPNNPIEGLDKLVKLNESKSALNNVMKYIDRTH